MEVKPIPAFYCCYLLRSTVRHASVYVGSTPNPVRRLAQHNGLTKGGAFRTSRVSLRPWEMTCVVSGFKSSIAALQFEWAWQNSHLTRHITADDRISFPTSRTKSSSKTGRPRKKPGRPRTSLKDKLANLHILLRSNYFSNWPLWLRFFSNDAYKAWQKCCQDALEPIPQSFPVDLDLKEVEEDPNSMQGKRRRKEDDYGKGGIEGLDTTYSSYRPALEKSQFLIVDGETLECAVCNSPLTWDHDLIVACTGAECNALSHVKCLSDHFLHGLDQAVIIPDKGRCPSCNTPLQWQELMMEMSLRLRAPKQVAKMLSKRNKNGASVAASQQSVAGYSEDEEELGPDEAEPVANEIALPGDETVEDESDDSASITSTASETTPKKAKARAPLGIKRRLPSVVEESDWEGAEIIH